MTPDDTIADEETGKIVQWYDGRPLSVPVGIVTGSVLAAFALGALAAVGALALVGRLRD